MLPDAGLAGPVQAGDRIRMIYHLAAIRTGIV
jgi:hypothetical protein